jgi:hypothetical protein
MTVVLGHQEYSLVFDSKYDSFGATLFSVRLVIVRELSLVRPNSVVNRTAQRLQKSKKIKTKKPFQTSNTILHRRVTIQ